MNAKDRVRLTLANKRSQRQGRSRLEQQRDDSRSQFAATYGGYEKGSHIAILANGAKMPVKWLSTGGMATGEAIVVSVARGSSRGFVRSMPR